MVEKDRVDCRQGRLIRNSYYIVLLRSYSKSVEELSNHRQNSLSTSLEISFLFETRGLVLYIVGIKLFTAYLRERFSWHQIIRVEGITCKFVSLGVWPLQTINSRSLLTVRDIVAINLERFKYIIWEYVIQFLQLVWVEERVFEGRECRSLDSKVYCCYGRIYRLKRSPLFDAYEARSIWRFSNDWWFHKANVVKRIKVFWFIYTSTTLARCIGNKIASWQE